jgi:Protein of unknown function (DUF1499)
MDESNAATQGWDEPPVPTETKRLLSLQSDWQTSLVLIGASTACLMGLFGPLGSGFGFWPWQNGLAAVFYSPFVAAVAFLLGILFIWRGGKTGKPRRPLLWLATLVGLIYLGWMASLAIKASSVPAIHDISTDLADAPTFQTLAIRADNLDNIPGADDDEMKGMSPMQRWTLLHQKAYGDIRSVRINQSVNAVMAKAARVAEDRDWEIVSNIPSEGRLEATATTALFRFKDDVVLRVRPTQDGTGSIVDMRSVSRVGQSDLGVNAERVRAFLADLSGTVTAAQ